MAVTVYLLNKNKEQFELVYNSTFTLLNKNDFISVYLKETLNNWILNVSFYDNNNRPPFAVDFNVGDDNNLFINCNKWYSDNWLENPNAFKANSKDGKTNILIKVRSLANYSQNHRTVEVTIWKKLPPV